MVAGALPLRGWRAAPPPMGHGVPSPLCTTIKLASPSPSLDSCAAGTLSVPFILSPCNPLSRPCPPRAPLSPPAAPPQPLTGCANHLFSDTSITTLVRLRSYTDLYRCSGLSCLFAHSSITPSLSAAWPYDDVDGMLYHPRCRLPAGPLALKSTSVLPSSRPSKPID